MELRVSPPALCRRDGVWRLTELVLKPFPAGTGPAGSQDAEPSRKSASCFSADPSHVAALRLPMGNHPPVHDESAAAVSRASWKTDRSQ